MTGVLPEEALQFAVWLDNNEPASDYGTAQISEEWRAVYDCLQYERCEPYIYRRCAGKQFEMQPQKALGS